MPTYKIDRVKPVSSRRRYEYLREHGVVIATDDHDGPGPTLSRKELDDYIDESIWREAHPGENPIQEVTV